MVFSPRHDPDLEEEPPLDPAAERIHQRLRNLLRISSLIMAAGLVAVFSAILYRVVNDKDGGGASGPATEIAVPAAAGARILAATPDGDRLALVVEEADGTRTAVVVDLGTGAVVARTRLVTAP